MQTMTIELFGGVSEDHVQGLVGLRISAPPEILALTKTLRFAVKEQIFETPSLSTDNQLSSVFVSHRVQDGSHRIGCELLDASGQVLSASEINCVVDNSRGIGRAVAGKLETIEFPVFLPGKLGDELFPADPCEDIFTEAPSVATEIAHTNFDKILESFNRDGFFISEKLLPDSLTDQASRELDQAAEIGWDGYKLGSSQRMHNMHSRFDTVRKIWLHPEILRVLKVLLKAEPMVCQTLTYINGSEQDLHQDTIHLSSFPRGSMIGVWVALEDVKPGSGELEYIVGSHTWPRVYRHTVGCEPVKACWKDFGERVVKKWQAMAHQHQPIAFMAKKGDVLFWHENLMHGGRKRLNPSQTRKSVVSHYFTAGSLVFYDSTAGVGYTQHLPKL